jgi:hypothetical protein
LRRNGGEDAAREIDMTGDRIESQRGEAAELGHLKELLEGPA